MAGVSNSETQAGESTATGVSRGEAIGLLGVVALAFLLRVIWPDSLTVEHYDEGVYASNLFAESTGYAYPLRHLYAPPVWPAVIETLVLIFGPAAACWGNVLAGSLLTVIVWRLGRDWFDPATGLTAATLVATDAVLMQYSRTALVDVPMTLLLAVGIWAGHRGVAERRLGFLIAAGVAAGLAWATKYSGWLTIAVLASGVAVWATVERLRFRQPVVGWAVLIVPAVALLFWIPVLLGLPNGYGEVSANHSKYVVGLSGFVDSAGEQLAAVEILGVGWVAMLPLAATAAWLIGRLRRPLRVAGWAVLTAAVAAAAFGAPVPIIVLVVSQLAAGQLLWRIWTGDLATPGGRLGGWLLLAWFHGLHLAIPLYTPYPRLTVPVVPAVCLVLAASLQRSARPERRLRIDRKELTIAAAAIAAVVGVSLGLTAVTRIGDHTDTGELAGHAAAFDDRDHAAHVARRFAKVLASQPLDGRRGQGVYVLGDPAVFFHLAAAAESSRTAMIVEPAGNLGVFDPANTDAQLVPYVVVGPYAVQTFGKIDDSRLTLVEEIQTRPSRLVALNIKRPSTIRRTGLRPQLTYRLYRVGTD